MRRVVMMMAVALFFGAVGTAQAQTIRLAATMTGTNETPTALVSGSYGVATVTVDLYVDTNGNGTQDPGEPNLAGVDVVITTSTGGTLTVSSRTFTGPL